MALSPCLLQEPDDSTEPPPSTRFHALQSPQLCQPPRLKALAFRACMGAPVLLSIARMSRSAQESSACLVCRRGAEEARMGVPGTRRMMERRRIASRHTHTDDTRTNGCLTTSASPMLLRRVMAKCLGRTIELEEGNQTCLCRGNTKTQDPSSRTVRAIFSRNAHDHSSAVLCHLSAPSIFAYLALITILATGRAIECGPKTPSEL